MRNTAFVVLRTMLQALRVGWNNAEDQSFREGKNKVLLWIGDKYNSLLNRF